MLLVTWVSAILTSSLALTLLLAHHLMRLVWRLLAGCRVAACLSFAGLAKATLRLLSSGCDVLGALVRRRATKRASGALLRVLALLVRLLTIVAVVAVLIGVALVFGSVEG